jgi:hypothetical protein
MHELIGKYMLSVKLWTFNESYWRYQLAIQNIWENYPDQSLIALPIDHGIATIPISSARLKI